MVLEFNNVQQAFVTAENDIFTFHQNIQPVNVNGIAPFSFRNRTEKINWKKIAPLDVNKVAQHLDLTVLQDILLNVTFCDIDSEMDASIIDANYIKIFKLAQLIIEYLLYSQECLSAFIVKLQAKNNSLHHELDNIQNLNKKLQSDLKNMKKESMKDKKRHSEKMYTATRYKCHLCPKLFISEAYLQSHFSRRHKNVHFNESTTEKIRNELGDMKNRFNAFGNKTRDNQRVHVDARTQSESVQTTDTGTTSTDDEDKTKEKDVNTGMLLKEIQQLSCKVDAIQSQHKEMKVEWLNKNNNMVDQRDSYMDHDKTEYLESELECLKRNYEESIQRISSSLNRVLQKVDSLAVNENKAGPVKKTYNHGTDSEYAIERNILAVRKKRSSTEDNAFAIQPTESLSAECNDDITSLNKYEIMAGSRLQKFLRNQHSIPEGQQTLELNDLEEKADKQEQYRKRLQLKFPSFATCRKKVLKLLKAKINLAASFHDNGHAVENRRHKETSLQRKKDKATMNIPLSNRHQMKSKPRLTLDANRRNDMKSSLTSRSETDVSVTYNKAEERNKSKSLTFGDDLEDFVLNSSSSNTIDTYSVVTS